MDKRNFLEGLKEKYPTVHTIMVEFSGSNDDFDDFGIVHAMDGNGNSVRLDPGFIDEHESILTQEMDLSGVSFNDMGAIGKIVINLEKMTMTVQEY